VTVPVGRHAVVVAGPPASGKSSLGARLAPAVGAALLDQDVMTRPLVAVVARLLRTPTDDLDSPRLRAASRDAVYRTLLDTAVANLTVGNPVVLIAPFTRERTNPRRWQLVRARLEAAGGAPTLLWMRCPTDELLRRLHARAAPRDRAKLADPRSYLTAGVLAPPAVAHTAIDATLSADRQLAQALAALDAPGPAALDAPGPAALDAPGPTAG
jgi:predicted kinase